LQKITASDTAEKNTILHFTSRKMGKKAPEVHRKTAALQSICVLVQI